jgi:hypothetical protein
LSATLKNTKVEIVSVVQRLGEMEAEKANLAKQLADARHRAAHPLSECWGEAVGLIDALDKASAPPTPGSGYGPPCAASWMPSGF